MPCLIIDSGEHKGRSFKLASRPLVGGRAPAAEIQEVDAKVSRRHFLVGRRDDSYTIRELRSTNGVWVNDERIEGLLPVVDRVVRSFATELPGGR